nr:hypothetical protein [Lysinibacillus timonensis]
MDIEKNTLYIIDMDVELNDLINHNKQMDLENNFVLQMGPASSAFDDFMRTIIIAIYEHNIEKIVIVSSPTEKKEKNLWSNLVEKFNEEAFREKEQTLNYLFKNCKPEYIGTELKDWFENRESQNTVNIIRQHPLIPPDIEITEISMLIRA